MLSKLTIPPGVARNGTQYQTMGRWYDANLMRWVDGSMRPVGGWERITTTPLAEPVRGLHAWRSNDGNRWLAIGSSSYLYINRGTATVYDVTPAGIAAGRPGGIDPLGYGGGVYGAGAYGVSTVVGPATVPTSWAFDNFGEILIGVAVGDGRIYEWNLNTAAIATQVTGAPTGCDSVLVSEQRHVVAIGAGGNPRKVQWSDKENRTSWTPSTTNEAGSFEVQSPGELRRGFKVRGQILLITDLDAHAMTYLGYPLVFGRDRVGQDCGILGANAGVAVEGFCVWMGTNRFWIYDGSAVRVLPCEVADYVFSSLNLVNANMVYAGHNGTYGEIWWHYPSGSATDCDRYVAWNYREDHWTIGALPRTAWVDRGVFNWPTAVGVDKHLYRHETGWLDNGATRVGTVYAETGPLELGDAGDSIMHVQKLIPDEQQRGEASVTFKSRLTPSGTESTAGPFIVRADGYTDVRGVAGRQVSMKVQAVVDDDLRIGTFRADVREGGKR